MIAARPEQARSVADVLLRRTRLGLLAAPSASHAPRRCARSPRRLGAELGWDGARIGDEAERWVADAAAEGIDPAASPT